MRARGAPRVRSVEAPMKITLEMNGFRELLLRAYRAGWTAQGGKDDVDLRVHADKYAAGVLVGIGVPREHVPGAPPAPRPN